MKILSNLLAVRFPVVVPCTRVEWCEFTEFTAHLNQYYTRY